MMNRNDLSWPHSQHRKYVRGCAACLERTKAGQRRMTESRSRDMEERRSRCEHRNVVPGVALAAGKISTDHRCASCYAVVYPCVQCYTWHREALNEFCGVCNAERSGNV